MQGQLFTQDFLTRGVTETPAHQALTEPVFEWGLLTNGNVWRLYWQDARSRVEDCFEVDVAAAMRAAGLMNGHPAEPTVADFVLPQVLARGWLRSMHGFSISMA